MTAGSVPEQPTPLDALPAHIAVLDATGRIVVVNAAWRRFADANGLGLPDHGGGADYLAVAEAATDPDDPDGARGRAMAAGIRAVLAGEQDEFTLEYPCSSPDEARWFLARVARVPGTEPPQVVVAHDTITARKRAEDAVREHERLLQLALEAAEAGVWSAVPATGEFLASDRALALHGLPPGTPLTHAAALARVVPEDRPRVDAALQHTLATGAPFRVELRSRLPNGEVRWLLSQADLWPDADPPRLVGLVQDITARKAAEGERTAILDALAHDVKNPLTAVKGQAQFLQRQLRRGTAELARQETGLVSIAVGVDQAIGLIDELLDAARLQSGATLELRPEPLDLVALTQASVAAAQATTERHALRLETATPTLVGTWDAARLRRVLDNLLGNAIKYSPRGGEIIVEVATEDAPNGTPWAVVTVVDAGIGIPEADLPHVFERWTRARNVAGRIAGSGIGLSGVKQIVEQHGGTIVVASREGSGSIFTVRLPLTARAATT